MITPGRVNEIRASDKRVWCVSWNHQGNLLCSCGEDKTIKIWSISADNQWDCQLTLPQAHKRSIRHITWSPCSTYIATASFDGTVVIWKLLQSESFMDLEASATLQGHVSEVKCVAWSPSGHMIATCGRDRSVWFWEFDDEEDVQCLSVLQPHTQDVKYVAWHPGGEVLVSTSYDDTINLYKEELDDWIVFARLTGHTSTVWKAEFSASGNILASCSDDQSLKLWASDDCNVKSKSWLCIITLSNYHSSTIFDLAWSEDDQFIASCGADNKLCVFRMPNNGLMCRGGRPYFENSPVLWAIIPNAHKEDVNCVRWKPSSLKFSPEIENHSKDFILTTASDDGFLKFWSIPSQE